jgi:hypothetical protein
MAAMDNNRANVECVTAHQQRGQLERFFLRALSQTAAPDFWKIAAQQLAKATVISYIDRD